MALDASIPLGVRPLQIEPQANALMRVMQLQSLQQGNALNNLQAQEYQRRATEAAALAQTTAQDKARKQAALQALPNPEGMAGIDPKKLNYLKLQRDLTLAGFQLPEKFAEMLKPEEQEVARTIEGTGPNGEKIVRQYDKQGREVGGGVPGYVAPVMVDQGGMKGFRLPTPGAMFPVTMSPAERDASARGWAGQAQADRHFNTTRADNAAKVDTKPNAPAQKVQDAKDVLDILNLAGPLLDDATGSYLGSAVDEAARVFGKSTPGAEASAKLKTLQGALIGKQPKMSGPQSDKDVQLYREMAGQIGDPTLPIATRKAAIVTIRQLNEKYAGIQDRPMQPVDTSAGVPRVVDFGSLK